MKLDFTFHEAVGEAGRGGGITAKYHKACVIIAMKREDSGAHKSKRERHKEQWSGTDTVKFYILLSTSNGQKIEWHQHIDACRARRTGLARLRGHQSYFKHINDTVIGKHERGRNKDSDEPQ